MKFKYTFSIFLFLIHFAAHALVVGNWNIHNGKKMDRILQEVTTSELRNADILAFQEVVDKDGEDQSQRLAEATGFYLYAPGRDILLSRYPFVQTGEIQVNDHGRKASWGIVMLPHGEKLLIYSIHLSYKYKISPFISRGRGKEMQEILNHAKNFEGPVVIAGDYNTVGKLLWGHKKEDAIKKVSRAGYLDAHEGIRRRTHKLVGLIDYQYYKNLEVLERLVGGYSGSDHRWLLATYELP